MGEIESKTTLIIISSWDHRKYTILSNLSGLWRLNVTTPAVGGPYNITFIDGEKLMVKNIFIGEVWVCPASQIWKFL
jgi:sialate O-acetylesterase